MGVLFCFYTATAVHEMKRSGIECTARSSRDCFNITSAPTQQRKKRKIFLDFPLPPMLSYTMHYCGDVGLFPIWKKHMGNCRKKSVYK